MRWKVQIVTILVSAAGPIAAQSASVGAVAPPLQIERWLVRCDETESAIPRVLAFLPAQRNQYLRGLGHLQELQEQFAGRAEVIGILPSDAGDLYGSVRTRQRPAAAVSVAIDQLDATRTAFDPLLDAERPGAVLLDAQGHIVRVAEFGTGLEYALEDLLAGVLDNERAAALSRLGGSGESALPAPIAESAEQQTRTLPAQWEGWCAQLRVIPDAQLEARAAKVLRAALEALEGRPEYAARVLQLAVARAPSLAREDWVAKAGRTAMGAAPRSPTACRAAFEIAAAVASDGEAAAAAMSYIEIYKGLPGALSDFARVLAASRFGARFREARLLALDLALQQRPVDRDLLERKLELLVEHQQDYAGAHHVGMRLVEASASDARVLNSLAWRLLTEEPFKGHMNLVALAAAQAMSEVDGWSTYWRLDTLALAYFANGDSATAARYQQEALEACGSSSRARYLERLDRYRKTQLAAPGK